VFRVERVLGLVLATGLCVAGLVTGPVATASADSATTLSIASYYQMVVDSQQGYIFISEGSSDVNDIIVLNLSGTEVGTIPKQDGVMGLALSSDGSTLYAALSTDDAVSVIDAATLTQTTTYSLGANNAPLDVVPQSGKLWVSYDTEVSGSAAPGLGGIGDFDLSQASPAFSEPSVMGGWYSAPYLSADPSDTGLIVAGLPNADTPVLASYDVAGNSVVKLASSLGPMSGDEYVCGPLGSHLAVAPNGDEVVLTCYDNGHYVAYRLSASTLAEVGTYQATNSLDAVAIGSDGVVALGGVSGALVYVGDSSTVVNSLTFDGWVPAQDGLAWAPDSNTLYAVLDNSGAYQLEILDNAGKASTALTLSGPSKVNTGDSLTLTGTLESGNQAFSTAGDTVTITRTQTGSSASATFTAVVGSNGTYSLTDTPPAGTYTYTASFAGSTYLASATASATATVARAVSSITTKAPSSAELGSRFTVTGTLSWSIGSPPAGTAITVTRTEKGTSAKKTFSVTTGSGGTFSLADTPPGLGSYIYTADYAGSEQASPVTGGSTVTVTRISTGLTLSTGGADFNYEPTIHVTAHLGTTYTNRVVAIYAQWLGSSKGILIAKGKVNSKGDLTASFRTPYSTKFTAVFSGDAHYAPASAAVTAGVRASVGTSISGYYATEKVNGTIYRLYHRGDDVDLGTSVAPNKHGECIKVEIQEYYNGIWNANDESGCVKLSNSSTVTAGVATSGADLNYPYRLRIDYGGDTRNVADDGAWQYTLVEK
jgi:YVTN family beta-propeller protein